MSEPRTPAEEAAHEIAETWSSYWAFCWDSEKVELQDLESRIAAALEREHERAESNWNALERIKEKWSADRATLERERAEREKDRATIDQMSHNNVSAWFKIADLQAELAAEDAELDALREDKERLDWLDRSGDIVVITIDPDLMTEHQPIVSNKFMNRSVREAIDAARKEKP